MISVRPIIMGELNLKIYQNFVETKNFLIFVRDTPLWREQYLLLQFHYFISLETVNTQKSQVFLLQISSGNVNKSGVITC